MAGLTYWGYVMTVIAIVSSVFATIIYLLRLLSRHIARITLRSEDLLMGVGLLLSFVLTTTMIMASYNGSGDDIWSLPPQTRRHVRLIFWLGQGSWPLSQLFIKLSIIVLLRRLIGSFSSIMTITMLLFIFTIAWGTTGFIQNIFQCWPPQYFWNKAIDGSCMKGQNTFLLIIGSLSLVEDVILLLTPVVVVSKMHLQTRKKVQILLLFSLGLFACVFSLLRLVELTRYDLSNLTAHGSLESIWTLLELHFAVICASLLLFRPLWQRGIKLWKSRCVGQKMPSSSGRSQDREYIFQGWPRGSAISNDACSEVRTQAFGPRDGPPSQDISTVEMGNIAVETVIERRVEGRDRV